jgi:hypothetical protein
LRKTLKLGRRRKIRYWKTGADLLADYDRYALPSTTPEEKFRHLTIAMEFVKNKGTSPSDCKITRRERAAQEGLFSVTS